MTGSYRLWTLDEKDFAMKWVFFVLMVLVAFLSGCGQYSDLPLRLIAEHAPRGGYFGEAGGENNIANHNPWVGRKVSELIADRGSPDMVLETKTRTHNTSDLFHTDSYIYLSKKESPSDCIRTFVVLFASGEIVKYYCV